MGHKLSPLTMFVAVLLMAGTSYAAGFTSAWQVERAETAVARQEDLETEFRVFWETWALVDRYFVDRDKLDHTRMIYGAIQGMVESLGDPHTGFADPARNATLRRDLEGTYEGIGVSVTKRDGQLVIIGPIEGSPGAKAGLRTDDVILSVDGVNVSSFSIYEAVDLIRGPRDSIVRLLILRPGADAPLEFTIARSEIRLDSVRAETLRGGVAYVKINTFRQGTTSQLVAALKKISSTSSPGLILDLRDNPGGYLSTAVDVTSQFLADGVVLYEEDKNARQQGFNVKKGGLATGIPMVVLVNKSSASASEIVAGALQDRGRAILIGQQTYGKGSVQTVRELSDGSGLRVTTAWWLTPAGRRIDGSGLVPDVVVDPLQDGDVDRVIESALQHLLGDGLTAIP